MERVKVRYRIGNGDPFIFSGFSGSPSVSRLLYIVRRFHLGAETEKQKFKIQKYQNT
jgi:hypothetical protein